MKEHVIQRLDIDGSIPKTHADRRIAALFGNDAYAIGGRVRDAVHAHFRGRVPTTPKDLDYVVVGRTLDQIADAFLEAGHGVNMVGASFCVLKVDIDGETVDVAIPRRERVMGPGHRDFEIQSGAHVTIGDDATRRDFTMNALALNLATGELVGPEGAIEDIRDGIIRMITPQSFGDDPLRMLRAAQFAARLGFSVETGTLALMKAQAHRVIDCSPERIRDELLKTLGKSDRPSVGIRILHDTGILRLILPELAAASGIRQNKHHAFDVFDHVMAALDASAAMGHDLTTRVAVMLHDIAKPVTAKPRPDGQGNSFHGHEKVGADMAREILPRLAFPRQEVETIALLVREHMYDRDDGSDEMTQATKRMIRRMIRRIGPHNVERQLAVRLADVSGKGAGAETALDENRAFADRVRAVMAEGVAVDRKAMAIDGRDVIAILIETGAKPIGFKGDLDVSVILAALLDRITDDPAEAGRDSLLNTCREMAVRMAGAKEPDKRADPFKGLARDRVNN